MKNTNIEKRNKRCNLQASGMSTEAGEQGGDDGSDEPQDARKCFLRIFFHFLFD